MYEYTVLLITVAIAINYYFDNQLFRFVYNKYRKYFNIMIILAVGFFVFYSLQMQTTKWKTMIQESNRYLPDDVRQAIHPVLDFTDRHFADQVMEASVYRNQPIKTERIKIMRQVTEKTKKLVAGGQEWKCAMCYQILPPTYEVDHIMRLEFGGTNDISNLQALCPNCHRKKTMLEKP